MKEAEATMNVSFSTLMLDSFLFRSLKSLFFSMVFFIIFSLLAFSILSFIENGFSILALKKLGFSELRIFNSWSFVCGLYKKWWIGINDAVVLGKFKNYYLIPFAALIVSASFLVYIFTKEFASKHKKYFPSLKELRELDIFGSAPIAFGRIKDIILKPKKATSALVWFGEDLGKTVSVAIPTILENNDANLVAVDTTGTLVQLTSGYRASVSKVFNFDWDMLDDYSKGEVYPRWNPLAIGNLPKSEDSRNAYIKSLSKYLIVKDETDYWENLAASTLEAIIHFFTSKVAQTKSNDYFLSSLLDHKILDDEESKILYSYYNFMDTHLASAAMDNLKNGKLTDKNFLPIGSWYGVPEEWHGKELCFAMIIDTMIQKYCFSSKDDNEQYAWRDMLNEFIEESFLFAYPQKKFQVFKYLMHLSIKQRKIVFSIILEALTVFRRKSVRERTSLSDFKLRDARGIIDAETGKRSLVSVYTASRSENSVFMTSFFVDVLLAMNIHIDEEKTKVPVLFVLDDFESLPKFKLLSQALEHSNKNNLSIMLLANNIEAIEYVYSSDELEVILNKTEYKLFSSENNHELSEKLQVVSNFLKFCNKVAGDKLWYQKSQTYAKVSRELLSSDFDKEISRGKYLLMADNFYGRPIKLESMFFMKIGEMKAKASLSEKLMLDKSLLRYRNKMDIEIPKLTEIIEKVGGKFLSEEDVDRFFAKRKEALVENISKIKDSKFDGRKTTQNVHRNKNEYKNINDIRADDWWQGEDEFFSDGELMKEIED